MKNLEALQILQKTGKRIFTLPEIKNLLDIEKDKTLNYFNQALEIFKQIGAKREIEIAENNIRKLKSK